MKYSYCFGGDPLLKTLKAGATIYAGSIVKRDTNKYGHFMAATTTDGSDALGVALQAATYATSAEGTSQVILNPFAVIRAKCCNGATEDTALTVLVQTSASTTVFTDADVGSADLTGGTMFILSGANAGLSRVVTSTSSATSSTVTVAFPNSIAVGDKGVWIPYSTGSHKVQGTTKITQADASIATGTGIDAGVVDVELELPINSTTPVIWVDFVIHDHILNPID